MNHRKDKDGNHLDNTYSYGSWGNTTTTAGGRTGNNELFYWEDAYSEVRNFASYV